VQSFPSVDHAILHGLLARHIACSSTMHLIDQIIASGVGIHGKTYEIQWFPGDELFSPLRPRGLPIGNQTSQFWSNVYLHELDVFVKQQLRCPAYLRYCDDFMLFAPDKPTLHRWRKPIEEFLVNLRLKIHPDKTCIYPVSTGIPFLGFRVYPDHRRLKRQNRVAFQRRYRHMRRKYACRRLTLHKLDLAVQGWIAHAAHGDTWKLRKSLLKIPVSRSAYSHK